MEPAVDSLARKQRKRRKLLSCSECRRLKLKCNREVPCSHCVRRKCVSMCSGQNEAEQQEGSRASLSSRVNLEESELITSQSHDKSGHSCSPHVYPFGTLRLIYLTSSRANRSLSYST
ncbi:hypothetical protein BCR39DRAFT_246411 [Naematelia encephala]|uniref:Zn(2)-C6 fungal-type domain-containing protein n=1 Tax=Naematelia encephala TaxID=71784 RepID=A0A1Y2AWQ6_9TREE|nr:hypothetical protein BCR39DRAFT_246411 [Naematelia encephala]